MPCTGSIYQHLSSTLITPGVSLSFVWDVRCITWKIDFILVNRHVVESFFVGLRSLVWEMYPGRHHQRPLISPYSYYLIVIIYHNHSDHLCNQVSGGILASGSLKVFLHRCRILCSPDLEGKTGKWALKWRKRACRNGGENPVTCDLWKTNIWKSRTTWKVRQLQQWIAKRWDRIDRTSKIFQLKRLKLWKANLVLFNPVLVCSRKCLWFYY